MSKAISFITACEAALSLAGTASMQAAGLEPSSKMASTMTCSEGDLHRLALVCLDIRETASSCCASTSSHCQRMHRLYRQVNTAARAGFAPALLADVLEDAMVLVDAWKRYLPSSLNRNEMIFEGAMPLGSETFTRQLWQNSIGKDYAPPASYCFYAHVLAIFVVARLCPLLFASQELGLTSNGMWVVRAGLRGADMKLPESLSRKMRMDLVDGLLLFGKDRVLDQMHLAGWPLGAAEITELKELLRAVCEGQGQQQRQCTVGAFERAAVSRFRRLRHLGGVRVHSPESSWWDDGWQGRLRPWLGTTNPSRPVSESFGIGLRTIMLGTHGALMNELQQSWRAAATQADMGSFVDLSFHVVGKHVYDPNKWLKKWVGKPATTMDQFLKMVPFETVIHQYIDPASMRASIWNLLREHVREGDAITFICTIPSVTCASLASMPWPVVLFAPTGVTVQVPREHYSPFLKLLVRMSQDPKNHFIGMGPYTRAQIEFHTSLRVPVIPVLALYINASYTGRFSSEVLVHDRTTTLLTQTLCALIPKDYPLRMVGFLQTDRQYSTFARHRAVVHVPGCLPEQMAFYEFYGMGIPLFIPADPTYYLWPRLPFTVGHEPSHYGSCGSYGSWSGKHQLKFADAATSLLLYANYTIRCNGAVAVHAISESAPSKVQSHKARLLPMTAMDELGNTHVLQLETDSGVHGHMGRCIRVTRWPVSDRLRVWMGPKRGACAPLDAVGGCEAGPNTACPGVSWVEADYLAAPPPAVAAGPAQREEPIQFERGGFGGTFWHLGSTTLSRRRRGQRPSTSPFDLNTHRALREWSAAIDFFRYPGLSHFVSLAALLRQLLELDPVSVGATMREFRTARRKTGLAAWRATLESIVRHESQNSLL